MSSSQLLTIFHFKIQLEDCSILLDFKMEFWKSITHFHSKYRYGIQNCLNCARLNDLQGLGVQLKMGYQV